MEIQQARAPGLRASSHTSLFLNSFHQLQRALTEPRGHRMNKTGIDAVQPEVPVEGHGSGAGQRLVGETAGHESEPSRPRMLQARPCPRASPPQQTACPPGLGSA